jgi:DNA-binding NarL/FixJ family response regulator
MPVVADDGLSNTLQALLTAARTPDVAIVSLDSPSPGIKPVRALRSVGYPGAIMVLCSRYELPSMEELNDAQVQSIVSTLADFEELETSLFALAEGRPEPLLQQYLRAGRALNPLSHRDILNAREKAILHLVAQDLTDQEIAERLDVSVRTVNNHLRHIYAKFGVRGRAGAVTAAILQGAIDPHS